MVYISDIPEAKVGTTATLFGYDEDGTLLPCERIADMLGTIIDEKSAQYPDWYTGGRVAYLRSLLGKVVYGFDCVNQTKGILWGWTSQSALSSVTAISWRKRISFARISHRRI